MAGARLKRQNIGIEMALKKRAELGNTHRYVWAIDYSINSRYPRFFVWDTQTGRMVKEIKAAHGDGGANKAPHDGKCREVSNISGSHMSTTGFAIAQQTYQSPKNDYSLKLKGLSKTNSRMLSRLIVIHRSDLVVDGNTNICGRTWGCPAIARKLYVQVINKLKDGAIGCMHVNGKFVEGRI